MKVTLKIIKSLKSNIQNIEVLMTKAKILKKELEKIEILYERFI